MCIYQMWQSQIEGVHIVTHANMEQYLHIKMCHSQISIDAFYLHKVSAKDIGLRFSINMDVKLFLYVTLM